MDIEYYRNFIAIAEEGSLSGAAKKLSIAQPALSNQIKILQTHYNARLLNIKRGGHNLELTEAGKILLKKARVICAEESSAGKEITASCSGYTGTLRISISPSLTSWFIHHYLKDFSKQYPDINFELQEITSSLHTEQLLQGKSEFSVRNASLEQSFRFDVISQKKQRLLAFFNQNSPLLENFQEDIELKELAGLPLCLPLACANLLFNVCSSSHVQPNILCITTTKQSAMAWAQENLGVAVAPAEADEAVPFHLVCRNIADGRLFLEKTMCVVKGAELTPVAGRFLEYLKSRTG